MPDSSPIIDIFYFDAGGGHRAAANAIEQSIALREMPWTVRKVHLQHLLDSFDLLKKLTGVRTEDVYNNALKHGLTLGSGFLLKAGQSVARFYHKDHVGVLRGHWSETKPDMVVSVVPNFNRAMYEGLKAANSATPYVTILTDMADYPPHFWIERNQDQWFICGTSKAAEQAVALGHPRERVLQTSGMILSPSFYEAAKVDREEERRRLGLDPYMATALVMFGGQGSGVMVDIAKRLDALAGRLQAIFICGHNDKLAAELRAVQSKVSRFVEGFTSQVAYYMQLADMFIGKPGPGSVSEALELGVPVIVERNAWTMVQERYNADWIREKGVGVVIGNFRDVEEAVRQMMEPGALAQFRANTAKIHNRAVFEIPAMLERILAAR